MLILFLLISLAIPILTIYLAGLMIYESHKKVVWELKNNKGLFWFFVFIGFIIAIIIFFTLIKIVIN